MALKRTRYFAASLVAALALIASLAHAAPTRGTPPALVDWVVAIQTRIVANWRPPDGALAPRAPCRVQVTLAATGEVTSATFKSRCGDAAFNQSLIDAVRRASPLPLPSDHSVFRKSLVLVFNAG